MQAPKVSVIIPCYNHGIYIDDAIASVDAIENNGLCEVIIINDGSTDELTNTKLRELAGKGYNVIFQANQGLSASRNNGIAVARGEYIMPLDSDNKLRPEYLQRGLEIFARNKDISIVYGNAARFGHSTEIFKPGLFNLQKLMLANYIDACAIYRKTVWETLGGYDTNMRTGFEDWEFWLHAAFKGFRFQYVDEVLFDYRVVVNSMVRQLNSSKKKNNAIIDYLIQKHPEHYGYQYIDTDIMKKFSDNPAGFIGKLILKKYFPKKFDALVEKGKLRKFI